MGAIGRWKWARLDSNQEPRDYESPALTIELQAHGEMPGKLGYGLEKEILKDFGVKGLFNVTVDAFLLE